MKFDSFMENLYFGKLDKARIFYKECRDNDPAVINIIEKFKDALSDYPPDKLESLGKVPDDLLEKLKKIGFFGLSIPGEYGGAGLDLRQYLAVTKEISKLDMAVGILSLAHLSIGIKAVVLFGNEFQKNKYLPEAAKGEMIFSYALTEPLIGSDAKNINTEAVMSDDGKYYILNGTKTFITNANYSGGMTVFAQMDPKQKGSLGTFIVETNLEGVSIGKDMDKMGLKVSSTASIQLKNVKVPVENLIGKPGDGFRIAMTVLNYGRLALGAASSGLLEESFHDMLKRATSRVQFDRTIINFELIREKIINAFVENQAVWAMTNFTAGLLDNNPTAYIAIESSHCKLYGTNRAWESLYDAMQTAGGAGYIKSMPYEKRMRDSRVATIFEGTTEIHSIYPPLSLLKNIMKGIFTGKSPIIMKLFKLTGLFLSPSLWNVKVKDMLLRNTLTAVKSYSRIFRNLFLSAMITYGKKLPGQELLLRRLTTISSTILILFSLVMKIRQGKKNGTEMVDSRLALEYLLKRSGNIVMNNNRLKPDGPENLFDKLINSFINL